MTNAALGKPFVIVEPSNLSIGERAESVTELSLPVIDDPSNFFDSDGLAGSVLE
jgi:hypothetical protein